MRKMFFVAGAAIAALSMPAFGQGHGHGAGGVGVGLGGGAAAGIPAGPSTLPAGPPQGLPPGPPATIPPSSHANANASGQVQANTHAQTDVHASDRAHERTGASVDHSTNVASGAGLANRTFRVGERVPASANAKVYTSLSATDLAKLPTKYQDTSAYRYIMGSNTIYVVSDSSNKVVDVVNLSSTP